MPDLTDKQAMFCKEYMIDLNATQAAIRAGYSEHTAKEIGYENLTKPYIQEYIDELKAERSKLVGIDAEWILKELIDIQVANKEEAPQHALRSLELLGKHLKMFTDKIDITDTTPPTPDQRKSRIRELLDKCS